MTGLELILALALGIGLAAASGFRVFIPLLTMSIAAHTGHLPLSEGFAWLGTMPALVMLAIAAGAEVLAYYVPGVDNLLDAIATPGAVIAGVIVSAAVMTDLPPLVKWPLAIIAGGGTAGLTQGATAFIRAHSTALTAGLGNPVLATGELVGSIGLAVLAFVAPYLAVLAIIIVLVLMYRLVRRLRRRDSGENQPTEDRIS